MNRDEQQEYEAAVLHGIWARGGNTDKVSHERLVNYAADGWAEDEAINREVRRQREDRLDRSLNRNGYYDCV